MSIVLTISEPPWSENAMYATNKSGRGRGRYKVRGYKDWQAAMAWEIKLQKPPTYDQRISVEIMLPMKVKGDPPNRIKSACDLLEYAGVVTNDKHCWPVKVDRANVEKTTITITEVA